MTAGAEYRPEVFVEPEPVTLHVTAWLVALATAAVNGCVAPPIRLAVDGVTETATAGMLNVMDIVLLGSACETAVTIAVAGVVSVAGAV
jgi:hypothetical protein